jgi:hypothetical protein
MTPLSLRSTPPREPRAACGGVIFLPRSIDKFRAALPGGAFGEYKIDGLTARMLEQLGISEAELLAAVKHAATDDDVAAFVAATSSAAAIAEWNAWILNRVPFDGDREKITAAFPWFADQPGHSLLTLDLLREDDNHLSG